MEIIHIDEEPLQAVPEETNLPPIEKINPGKSPLGVELLEDRELLATGAAPSAAATPADVEAPHAPAAYVAEPHTPLVPARAGHAQPQAAAGGEVPEAGRTAAGGSPTSVGGHSDSATIGLVTHVNETHAEVVERPTDRVETIESKTEERIGHHFGDKNDSEALLIEPDGTQTPQDRDLARRLVESAGANVNRGVIAADSPETANAKASAVVSLMSESDGSLAGDTLERVVDDIANKLAQDTSIERERDTATADPTSIKSHAAPADQASQEVRAASQATAVEDVIANA